MHKNAPPSGGYIRLYRSLLTWEWFRDSPTLHVFLYLLLTACFAPIRREGVALAAGQLITARRQIAERTGLSEQQVRTALKRLVSTREITIEPGSRFSLVTLHNFARYQGLLSPAAQPAANPPLTHYPPKNKNDNHVNHEKKGAVPHENASARSLIDSFGVYL